MIDKLDGASIEKYITQNATKQSIAKAKDIHPILQSINSKKAVFLYQGSGNKPYIIEITFNNNKLGTHCNCPYDFGGICKHSIASLQKILLSTNDVTKIIANRWSSNSAKEIKKEEKNLEFALQDGVLNEKNIFQVLQDKGGSGFYSNPIIQKVSKDAVEVESTVGWKNSKQSFIYHRDKDILEIKCSCSIYHSKKYCEHLLASFKKIINVFGNNYFQENYFDRRKEDYLADFGMTLKDDYKKFFDFEIGTEGIRVSRLFPNIKRITDSYENQKITDINEFDFISTTQKEEYGEALIFEFSDDYFYGFVPIRGKLNKEGVISTKIKEITSYDLQDKFDDFDNESLKMILKAHKLSISIKKMKAAKDFHKAITLFNELLKDMKSFPLFAHEEFSSYVLKNLTPLFLSEKEPQIIFSFTEDALFYHLKPKIKIGAKTYMLEAKEIIISSLFIKEGDTIYPIKNSKTAADLEYYISNPESSYIKKNNIAFKDNVLIPLSKKYKIEGRKFKKVADDKSKVVQNALEKHLYIEEVNGMVKFTPAVQYPEKLIDIESEELRISANEDNGFTIMERDTIFETQFRDQFISLHPSFKDQGFFYMLNAEEFVDNFWFLEMVEKLKNTDVQLFGAKELTSFKYNLNKPSVSVSVKSDTDWFDISIDMSFGDQKVSLKDLQKAFVKKSNFITLGDGSLGILPEDWMAKFSGYFKAGKIDKEQLKISNYQFGIIDELYHELEEKPDFLIELYEKKRRIQNIGKIKKLKVPEGIVAVLRDYQLSGLNWLNFLDQHQLGGCLADDMGLGKTIQIITFLQHLKLTKKPEKASLIIAPTSLIFNWQNEINKFCPTLQLLVFTGINRSEHIENFNDYDVVITTYGSVLNDIEVLKNIDFNYIILDESQAIKNPNSKRYKSVRLLKSYNRVVLTGTPIENNTFDLYAQFNFVNPGLLGNMAHFKKEFSDAIDKEKDVQTSDLLSKIINPFMLRRTKEQVATELPEKIESVLYCEMEKEQRKIYDTFKNQYRDFLMNKIDENGIGKSQMYILEGLTKLRQICNSPATLSDKEEYSHESVKLNILIENITEKTGNHKILIFSSFVKMLELVKDKLDESKIPYEYLDGQTRDRQAKVENFQNQKDIRVFLISMKAGGTGLNLTEADYVFIIDPWWNPAVENQAIDRCYRIGQKKQVMAYRMICKDTIEEKILNLQQKKKKIANSIISVDEESKAFNAQEVKDLFA